MKYYFDPSYQPDVNRIHPDYRDDELIEYYAKQVERDIRREYTNDHTYAPDGIDWVRGQWSEVGIERMIGYHDDPDKADEDFRDDHKDQIATVIQHRIEYDDYEPHIGSEGIGRLSFDYQNIDPKWPSGWRGYLKRYDPLHDDEVYF